MEISIWLRYSLLLKNVHSLKNATWKCNSESQAAIRIISNVILPSHTSRHFLHRYTFDFLLRHSSKAHKLKSNCIKQNNERQFDFVADIKRGSQFSERPMP